MQGWSSRILTLKYMQKVWLWVVCCPELAAYSHMAELESRVVVLNLGVK